MRLKVTKLVDGQVVKYKHMLIQGHQNLDMTISQLRQYSIGSSCEGERASRHCSNGEYAELENVAKEYLEDVLRASRALRQLEVQAQLDEERKATKSQRRWERARREVRTASTTLHSAAINSLCEDGATFAVDRDAGGARLSRVTHGAGTWVAGGVIPSELGGTAADVGVLWTSRDAGETWTEQVLGEGRTVRGLAFVDGHFLLADGASLFRSDDGEDWELVNAFGMELLGGFGQRLFAASSAALHRSDDGGFSWTEVHADDAGPSFMELMVGVQP